MNERGTRGRGFSPTSAHTNNRPASGIHCRRGHRRRLGVRIHLVYRRRRLTPHARHILGDCRPDLLGDDGLHHGVSYGNRLHRMARQSIWSQTGFSARAVRVRHQSGDVRVRNQHRNGNFLAASARCLWRTPDATQSSDCGGSVPARTTRIGNRHVDLRHYRRRRVCACGRWRHRRVPELAVGVLHEHSANHLGIRSRLIHFAADSAGSDQANGLAGHHLVGHCGDGDTGCTHSGRAARLAGFLRGRHRTLHRWARPLLLCRALTDHRATILSPGVVQGYELQSGSGFGTRKRRHRDASSRRDADHARRGGRLLGTRYRHAVALAWPRDRRGVRGNRAI